MASIEWGDWEYSGGNGMRVGIEVDDISTVTHSSSSCTVTWKVYTQNQFTYSDAQTLNYDDSIEGEGPHNFTNSSGSSSVLRDTVTSTWTYDDYATNHHMNATATISGAFNGVTPTVTVRADLPQRPVTTPAAVTGIAASRSSDTNATISWTNHATTAAPYSSLTLQYRYRTATADFNAWATLATPSGSATAYAFTTGVTNRVYEFQVRANNSAGSSAYDTTGYMGNTPGAPSSVVSALAATGTTITTTWTNNHYVDADINLKVERSVAGGSYTTLTSSLAYNVVTYTDSSPGVGTNQYRVTAVQTVGSLASSATAGNVVSTVTAPVAPSSLAPDGALVDFTGDVVFTWQHNPGGDGAVQTHYTLEVSSNGGSTWTAYTSGSIASATSSHTITGGTLTNGVSYAWRVKTEGVTSAGYGPTTTAHITGHSVPVVAITAPADSDTVTALPLTVEWTYSQDEGSDQVAWSVQVFDPDGVRVVYHQGADDSTSYVVTGLAPGTGWTVEVGALSTDGQYSNYPIVTFDIDLLPPADSAITAVFDSPSGSMVLTVTPGDAVEDESSAVDSFDVQRSIDGGAWVTILAGIVVTGSTDPVTLLDTVPTISGTNSYRLVLVASSTATSTGDPIDVATSACGFYLNYGPGFNTVLRCASNPSVQTDASRIQTVQPLLGQSLPVLIVGQQTTAKTSVSGSLGYGDQLDDDRKDSPPGDWENAARVATVVCLRTPTGVRVFGSLQDLTVTPMIRGHVGSVGFSVTATRYSEIPNTLAA